MAVRKQRKTHKKQKTQRGGSPTFAYTGDVIMTKTGAPQAVWTAADPYAVGDVRAAPQLGGRRRSQRQRKSQRGGGCGCMGLQRGGSSNGGYSTVLSNMNTGYPEAYVKGACLPAQVGGADGSPAVVWSDRAGYGLVQPYNSANANFMEYVPTGRAMQLGGRKRSDRKRSGKNKNKSKRRSRR